MNLKSFYDNHTNFSCRSLLEYEISPGIKCKFDLILENIEGYGEYAYGLDLGCSGNSILYYLKSVRNSSFLDISEIPLAQYTSKSKLLLRKEDSIKSINPLCGDINNLPYLNEIFDIVCSLDTLEHIRNDYLAVEEISRVLKKNGICIITVPHRIDLYNNQDRLIGHYRRYEIDQIIELFNKNRLRCLRYFNVYGKFMKIAFLQALNPEKTEQKLITLRHKYQSNLFFKYFWKIIAKLITLLMKMDAKYRKVKNGMNVGFIFIKK
jgi:SAM-dependent methyltransferase